MEPQGDPIAPTGQAAPLRPAGGGDPVLQALGDLEDRLEESAATERALGEQVRQLRDRRLRGLSWREATDGAGGTGGVLHLLGHLLSRLTEAGAVLRRALAAALMEEGASTAEVAQRFGVSRQRIFRLLRGNGRDGGEAE